jgi:cell division protein FtsI/penicillin-binding protein 2
MFVFFCLSFAAVGARLFVLQIIEAPAYAKLAADQRERVITFPARRGTIFDRAGDPLAISVDLQTIFADPSLVDDIPTEAAKLAPVLGMDMQGAVRALSGTIPGDRFEYIERQVGPKLADKVKALHLAGVYMEPESRRYYPAGHLASHVLGFVDIDGKGLEGVEAQYESILQGEPGRRVFQQDPQGNEFPGATYERPKPGRSLFLTLDKQLQYFTELTLSQAVGQYHADAGTAIVMKPGTGEILALANVPTFDPNHAGDADSDARRNRALTDVYEPGSAFKVVTVSGALQDHVVRPETKFQVPDTFAYSDRVFHDAESHAPEELTVAQIIQQSSNVGTIQIGLRLGADRIDHYVHRFGFGARTGLDFPGESSGIVIPRRDWTGSTIATIPIGQGIAVTPMQMAAAYSAIANRGQWVEPKLLYASMGSNGKVEESAPAAHRRVVSPKTAREVTKILEGVTEHGTGIEAQIPGYMVAGKTGTAQKALPGGGYGDDYVASFGGYAPATNPAVVVMVVLDDPSPIWGGSTAAPTFKTIMEFALRHLGVPPTDNAERAVQQIEADRAQSSDAHD